MMSIGGGSGKDKTAENNGTFEFPYMKPPTKTTWESFKTALWDPENKTVFGRTGKNWGQLLIFYTCFYAVLAAFFAICMSGLLSTLSDREPKWTLGGSIIGTNPGVGFRPMSKIAEEGSLIYYNVRNETSRRKWVNLLNDFFIPYEANNTNRLNCTFDTKMNQAAGQSCNFPLELLGECLRKNEYGYNSDSPCVFLKLNKIFGWNPLFYNDSKNLPTEMPEDLKKYISDAEKKNEQNQVWVTCKGEYPADKESIVNFTYHPKGIRGYYFPYTNQEGYLSPLVAVRLINPKPNTLVSIECRAWAININYRSSNIQREGSAHIEFMKDNK